MLAGPAFTLSYTYVPLKVVRNVPALLNELTVSYIPADETTNYEDDFGSEGEAEARGLTEYDTIKCYDLSVQGYIGLPRAFARKKFPFIKTVDRTPHFERQPELFPSKIKPRDPEQAEFWYNLKEAIELPGPQDIVANARTGTGKTITALWLAQDVFQAPILVTVPNNFLLNQWRQRIRDMMGAKWYADYVGHIQQDTMDFEGRLITLGLAPSLSIRTYPLPLRRGFAGIFFDEWHKIGAPRTSRILGLYPARVRIGLTATNRKDALLKVCTLHLGRPRIKSKQRVMEPVAYTKKYERTMPRDYRIATEFQIISLLSQLRDRNDMLADLIYERGWLRDRHVVALSDRTDQLIKMKQLLVDRGVPPVNIGIVCGTYKGQLFSEYRGKVVPKKITMTAEDKDLYAGTCNIVLTTWGQFDTGADIDHLDMGVELTPRSNIRQGMGRVLRILENKPDPEWYSINDTILYYEQQGASLFADPRPIMYDKLAEMQKGREASYKDQSATVRTLD